MTHAFEAGTYRARIQRWGLSKAKTGNSQFVISFMPIGLKDGETLLRCPQFERSLYRVITDNTIDYFVSDLQRLGYTFDSFDQLDPDHPQAFNFRDMEIDVTLDYETYEGKERERWKFAWGGGAKDIAPLDRREVSALNASFGAKLKALRAANGAAANRPAQSPTPTPQSAARQPASAPAAAKADEEVF